MELIDTETVARWTSVFAPTIAEAPSPCAEAATLDEALSRDANPGQRLGMWLALLDLDAPVEQREALRGIARLVNEVSSIRTATALMLVARLSRDELWFRHFAIEPCVEIVSRIADLNPTVCEEAASYGRELSANDPRAAKLLVRHARLDPGTVILIVERLAMLDTNELHPVQIELEVRLRQQPDLFVPYVETLMRRFSAFDPTARESILDRLAPILNREIRRDFTRIDAATYERVGRALVDAPAIDDERRRYLIWELVPHSEDLAERQPLAPALRDELDAGVGGVLERVFATARSLDALASAGFLLNVLRRLETSPLRFAFAERLITEYSGYDLLRRAATIDVVGRQLWKHLFRQSEPTPADVEGLAEASEPELSTMEIELVEQIRGELQRLRLQSFPRI